MKLVRFDDWRTGLLVELPEGPYLVDVVASLGVFLPEDPIANGILNGVLKAGRSWAPVIQHWKCIRPGLRRLALLASTCPDHPQLTMRPFRGIDVASAPGDFQGIAALEIGELSEAAVEGLRRTAMERRTAQPVTKKNAEVMNESSRWMTTEDDNRKYDRARGRIADQGPI